MRPLASFCFARLLAFAAVAPYTYGAGGKQYGEQELPSLKFGYPYNKEERKKQ